MAGRFRFRLEALLRVREALEKEAQRALARAVQAQQALEAQKAELEQERTGTVEGRRQRPGQAVDLELWRAAERYLVVLERRLTAMVESIARAVEAVSLARKELNRAHQEHLMLVRLKERRREQHRLEQEREEARQADELAVLRQRFKPGRPAAGEERIP